MNKGEYKKAQEELIASCPILFSGDEGVKRWGVECRAGWFPIIKDLCEKLEAFNGHRNQEPYIRCGQIKEKLGGLRFYLESGHAHQPDLLIKKAEEDCSATCESCGAVGSLRNDLRYIRTLCEKHYKESKD